MKIKEFQCYLQENSIDFALFLNSALTKKEPNLFYFAQQEIDFGLLVIPKAKKPFLIIPGFEHSRIKKASNVRVYKAKKGGIFKNIKRFIRTARKIGINKKVFSVSELAELKKEFKKCRIADVSEQCSLMRASKTPQEIQAIKKACRITDELLQRCIKKFRQFSSEQEICQYINSEIAKTGCAAAFNPIVACAGSSSYPHHRPSDRLGKGFCVIDLGVKCLGYGSDLTRTIYFGRPTKKEKNDYELVRSVQQEIISMVKPGMQCSKLHRMAEKLLGAKAKYFSHGIGHGIGIEIHEKPSLGRSSHDVLKEGMIITIEPGIYLKKYGIRIEDSMLVTKKGAVLLTQKSLGLKLCSH